MNISTTSLHFPSSVGKEKFTFFLFLFKKRKNYHTYSLNIVINVSEDT